MTTRRSDRVGVTVSAYAGQDMNPDDPVSGCNIN